MFFKKLGWFIIAFIVGFVSFWLGNSIIGIIFVSLTSVIFGSTEQNMSYATAIGSIVALIFGIYAGIKQYRYLKKTNAKKEEAVIHS